ncbi:MAG TPA: lipid-A-disaccharide synthase-related protein [Candidatus Baltobacteraceae bacterium]|jgi:uncharacterized protein (TIGR03492 family)
MTRALFVSNGHGEEAIATRLASELQNLAPIECDHLALVGDFGHPSVMRDVGPRRVMPSGGLIAMGNLPNIARDLASGLVGHTLAQWRFLRSARGAYDVTVAVGDVFALMMALQARAPAIYVGTAKSVYVAPYGPFEARVLRRARAVFVRDAATAQSLQDAGVAAQAPGNVIVDLNAADDERIEPLASGFAPLLGLFPGSRAPAAYADARFLCGVVRGLARTQPHVGGILSIAPGLEVARFAEALAADGWDISHASDPVAPFVLRAGAREVVRAWRGGVGPIVARATVVLGQAGTANEVAAAGGVPVVAFELAGEKKTAWYRKRQAGLLGDALQLGPGGEVEAAACVRGLLDDAPRRVRMGSVGRQRMGPPGGARAIAQCIAEIARAT